MIAIRDLVTALIRALVGLVVKAPTLPIVPAVPPKKQGDEDLELLVLLGARRDALQRQLAATEQEIEATCWRLRARGYPQFADEARTEGEVLPPN